METLYIHIYIYIYWDKYFCGNLITITTMTFKKREERLLFKQSRGASGKRMTQNYLTM